MLLPALTKAREQARTTACGAQLKQVVNSLFLYAEDYGRFPNSHWYGFIQGNYVEFQWNNLVADAYLSKTKTVYLCPSDSTVNRAGNIGIWNISYGVSESGPCPPRDVIGSTPSGASAYRPVDVPNPNGTVLVSDSTEVLLPVDVVSPPAPAPPNNQLYRNVVSGIWDVRYFPSRRHSGSSNVGFCDGHLQYLSWDKLMPAIPGGVPLGDTLRYKLWFLLPLPVR